MADTMLGVKPNKSLREVNNIFIQASTRSDGIPIRPVYDPK